MARPVSPRKIHERCELEGFFPVGKVCGTLEPVVLPMDEWEALRLSDSEGLYQEEASSKMGVSRATFSRILQRGRSSLMKALLEGRRLYIGAGPVVVEEERDNSCPVHGGSKRRGRKCRCRGTGYDLRDEAEKEKG